MSRSDPPAPLSEQLEELGLSSHQARVLLALLRAGAADSARLADLSGVQRTSVYRVISSLTERGLVEIVPRKGPTVWTSHGWNAVLDALDDAAQERLHLHRARASRLRDTLSRSQPSPGLGPSRKRSGVAPRHDAPKDPTVDGSRCGSLPTLDT